jgi:hypothetical protein
MVSLAQATKVALALGDVVEQPHFEKTSFRTNKKIFLTLDVARKRGCVKLSLEDQDVFTSMQKEVVYPVPNAWGRQGWTFVELKDIKMAAFVDLVGVAYNEVRKSGPTKRK